MTLDACVGKPLSEKARYKEALTNRRPRQTINSKLGDNTIQTTF
jgi:hypothetical protein